jgi:hypothetical protein
VILDESVGYRYFCDEPKGDTRCDGTLRASYHERAAAIIREGLNKSCAKAQGD